MMHTLKAGDHVVSIDDVYAGTQQYFTYVPPKCCPRFCCGEVCVPAGVLLHRMYTACAIGMGDVSEGPDEQLGEQWGVVPGCTHLAPVSCHALRFLSRARLPVHLGVRRWSGCMPLLPRDLASPAPRLSPAGAALASHAGTRSHVICV